MKRNQLTFRLLLYEAVGAVALVIWAWLDQYYNILNRWPDESSAEHQLASALEHTLVISILCISGMAVTYALLRRIKYLEGLLPICCMCKRIRTKNEWHSVEAYIEENSAATFTHSYCPDCVQEQFGGVLAAESAADTGTI